MNYIELKKGLSEHKLKSYSQYLHCKTDKELIASYMVLQSLQEKFYLPFQLVELTLRNNINTAIREHLRTKGATENQINRWYNSVPKTKESKAQVVSAKIKAEREIKGRGANHNDVIARLTFGFWVYLLDKPHRLNGPDNADHQLWPYLDKKVFPNKGNNGIPSTFSKLNDLNKLRNRLFHHEPIWSGAGINSKEAALERIHKQYLSVIEMLNYLSPDKYQLVSDLNLIGEFNIHCTLQKFIDFEQLLT
jgi:hypothetical protein